LKIRSDHSVEKAMEDLFADIFRQYEQRLYTLALRLTKSEEVAKDIIQEVLMKLWEQRNIIHSIKNKEAWLYKLTENKVIDFLRKASADDRLKKKIWDNLQQILNDTEQHLEAKEYNQVIQKAIEQLPPQRRLIYQLNKEEGMDYQQIATELQLSKHTVKNQLFSAVQSLRRFISKNNSCFLFIVYGLWFRVNQ
jgi:RNA polymerase sigma-70 factor (family 1)